MTSTKLLLIFTASILSIANAWQNAHANEQGQKQLSQAQVVELVQRCAPDVHPTTMLSVLNQESGFQPYVIGVNSKPREVHTFKTPEAAAKKARELLAAGKSIDMGLGQITSKNLAPLKLTPDTVFDPCTNVAASAQVLREAYGRTSARAENVRVALDGALSIYNTGNPERGVANGYVGSVRAKRYAVPALDAEGGVPAEQAGQAVAVRAEEAPEPPAWDVFARARYRPASKPAEQQPELAAAQAPPAESAPETPKQQASAGPVILFGQEL